MTSGRQSLLVGIILACAVSCSRMGGLSRSRVADTIRSSADFTEPKSVFFKTGDNLEIVAYEPEYSALKSLGLIDIRGTLKSEGLKVTGLTVSLTDRGIRESRSWKREDGKKGVFWTLPIASRKLNDIIGIRPVVNKQAEIEFSWSWLPNAAGDAISASVNSLSTLRDADLEQNERAYREQLSRAPADSVSRLQEEMFHRQRAEQEDQLFSVLARSKRVNQSKVFTAVVTFYQYDDGWHPSSKRDEGLRQALDKSERRR